MTFLLFQFVIYPKFKKALFSAKNIGIVNKRNHAENDSDVKIFRHEAKKEKYCLFHLIQNRSKILKLLPFDKIWRSK